MTRAPIRSQPRTDDLRTTPFAHLLIELFDTQRTGSLLIYAEDDSLYAAIRIDSGRPIAVLTSDSPTGRVSDLLMPLCAWTQGRYDFADNQDLVGSDGLVAAGPIDPVPMITAACRVAMREDVVTQTMGLISRSLIKLNTGLELRRYNFTTEERLVVRGLDQGPISITELRTNAAVSEEVLRRVLYVLRITRGISLLPLQRSASGTVSHAAPMANRSLPPIGSPRVPVVVEENVARDSSNRAPMQSGRAPSQTNMPAQSGRSGSQPSMPARSGRPSSQPSMPAQSGRPGSQPSMPAQSGRPGSQSRMPAVRTNSQPLSTPMPNQRPGSQPRMPAVQGQRPLSEPQLSAPQNSRPISRPITESFAPNSVAQSSSHPPTDTRASDSKRPLLELEERERRGEAEGLWLQAESLSRKSEYDAALRLAQRALKVITPPPAREALLGWLMYQHAGAGTEVHPHVWTCLNRALKREPLCEDALYYKGLVLGLSGNPDQAQAHFERVLMLNPKHADAEREVRMHEMRRANERSGSGFLSRFLSKPPKPE